jgi:protein SCO1
MACWEPKIVRMFRIALFGSSLIALCLLGLSCKTENTTRLPYYNTPDFSPIFVEKAGEVPQKISHTISDFSFTDQHGANVTQQAVDGKIHVANFFFTTCGVICPRMTNHMQRVAKAFPQDNNLTLLSYSVTPWIDSVGRLNAYCQEKNIRAKNWHLLTGSKSAIYQLARQSYFAEEELGYTKDSTEFLHTEHFLLVDRQRRIRGIYNGTLELEIEQLIADIKTLRQETD